MTGCDLSAAPVTTTPPKRAGIDYSKFDNIEDSDDEKPAASGKEASKPTAEQKPHCANCMKETEKTLRCGTCKKVEYCSQQCQREDWQFHKRMCKKPEPPKAKEASPGKKAKAPDTQQPKRSKSEDKVVEDDEDVGTWYKHREWKPSSEPKKEFKPVQITGTEAAAVGEGTKATAGSAWNKAGTWEDKDVTAHAHSTLKRKLEQELPALDVAGGALSVVEVKSVDGEASKPVVRGKQRSLFDLSFKVKLEFKWMSSSGKQQAEGTLEVSDFTNDTRFEGGEDSLQAPFVKVSFKGLGQLEAGRREAVEQTVGATEWPARQGSLLSSLAARMAEWAGEFVGAPDSPGEVKTLPAEE